MSLSNSMIHTAARLVTKMEYKARAVKFIYP